MPESFQSLLVILGAVLPGALYTWAFEREAGAWGARVTDRALRFVGVSAMFAAFTALPLHWFWRSYLHRPTLVDGDVTFRNLLAEGSALPFWFWLLPILFVLLPVGAGTVAGMSITKWPAVSRWLVGKNPAPRAWDHVFFGAPAGVVRLELKDGRYIGGLFGEHSYASGYPEEPQDLFIEQTFRVLANGEFAHGTAAGGYDEIGGGVLIRWDEVRVFEFFAASEGG